MKYNFPQARHSQRNSMIEQFRHVESELREAYAEFQSANILEFLEEMADLTHSIETFWRIVERDLGKAALGDAFRNVENKNLNRGYYQ